jgi:outer membrane protein
MNKALLAGLLTIFSQLAGAQSEFTLAQAVEYALVNSNTIRLQAIEVSRAEADIKEFRSIGLPKIDAGVDYSYYFQVPIQPVQDFIGPSVYGILFNEEVIPQRDLGPPEVFELAFIQPNNLTGQVQASSLLFSGSYIYGLQGAKIYKELTARQVDATEQEIKSQVTKAYMSALIASRNQRIIANNITTIEKSLREVKAMYEEGFAESLDVDRLTLTMDNLRTEYDKLNQLIQLSKNLLKFQMGYPMEEAIELSESIEDLENQFVVENIDLLEEIDYSQRAEYAVLEMGQELNQVNLKANKAEYLPSASAFVSHQQSLLRNDLFDSNEAGWLPTTVAGVSINMPIYDGGEKSAKIQKVKLDIEKLNLEKENFERAMTLEVRNAQLAFINAQKTLDNRKKSLEITERIFKKTQIKFTEGVGSSVEVTQAEGQLFEAQGAYINALYELLTAKTDLDIAKGTL